MALTSLRELVGWYIKGVSVFDIQKDSEAVLGVWLPAPLQTSRGPPDRGALWPLA